ncbi:MAG TPA: hypothetical protein VGI54_02880 [Solirubrobacteraceae bacterium]|jgi:thiol:disulfide interchange protein
MRTPTAPVAAGSLVLGYVVARETGVRPLGGVVLLAGGAWCAYHWQREAGTGVAAALVGTFLVAFAGSHVLAKPLGAWPSVLLVSAATAAAAWTLADRPARSRGLRGRLAR